MIDDETANALTIPPKQPGQRSPLYKSRSFMSFLLACATYLLAGWQGMPDAGAIAYGIAAGLSVLVGGEKVTDMMAQKRKDDLR